MKKFILILSVFLPLLSAGQNIGIGTSSPPKLLTVKGSVLLDESNQNVGTIDSAALLFGTNAPVALSSNKSTLTGTNPNGLDIWTNGFKRVSVTNVGYVGIGTATPSYRLDVAGTANVNYLYTNGLSSTGSIYTDYDLIANDDLFVADDGSITGNLGVGEYASASYRLLVNGNALVRTNIGVDGTMRVDGKITNDGKGIMKSNNSTTLRSGFSKGTFSYSFSAGSTIDVKFCITTFSGDNDNVRPMISQFIPGSGNSNTGCLNFLVVATTASDNVCGGGSTATVRITNTCSTGANTGTNSVLHLYTVVTD